MSPARQTLTLPARPATPAASPGTSPVANPVSLLVMEAGQELLRLYRKGGTASTKARHELVTEADHRIEKLLVHGLTHLYPGDAIYSEESGDVRAGQDNGRRWIIDPLDGTADYAFGVPYFAISVCLETKGRLQDAWVFNPVAEEFYRATAGKPGAFLNGHAIKPSAVAALDQSLVALGFSANWPRIERCHQEWPGLFELPRKTLPLITPALTLCNIARGRLEAFIDPGCSQEGQAAAALILQQAGGALWNHDGSPYDHRVTGLVATNGVLELPARQPA